MRTSVTFANLPVMAERRHVRRRQVILTLIPPLAFAATAVPLWGETAGLPFFTAATNVLALGGIALVLQARFFRVAGHAKTDAAGALLIVNLAFVLVSVGVGLGVAFGALGNGEAHHADLALVAGSMATQVAAFAVTVLFGSPGDVDE